MMERGALHACPVRDCPGQRQRWMAVCAACWHRLPHDHRAPIVAARNAKARHLEASAAMKAVNWLNAHAPAQQAARITGESP